MEFCIGRRVREMRPRIVSSSLWFQSYLALFRLFEEDPLETVVDMLGRALFQFGVAARRL